MMVMMNRELETLDLPEGVGPHEGRELELMLAGVKPMAMFSGGPGECIADFYREDEFMVHVRKGAISRRDETYFIKSLSASSRYIYYALANETWRVDKMHELQREFAATEIWTEDRDREVGRLLGYTESEITTFLSWKKTLAGLS
jgi:hypothetical protein